VAVAGGVVGGGVVGGGAVGVVGAVDGAVGVGVTGAVGWCSAAGGMAVAAGTPFELLVALTWRATFFCLSFVSEPRANPAPTPIASTATIPAAIHALV
jgi:hypothetical protein